MKRITIESMEITGFKGIAHLQIDLSGQNAIIAGRNGTGKTSVYDAFLWLLFGKVSDGSKGDVKPVDGDGKRKSGIDCEVSARLMVDGKPVELRRQWHEVWKKPAGASEAIYDRDQTLCWIDDVPKALEKEYTPYVLSLMGNDESVFKLITDHGAFMRMHWTERRKKLMEIAGVNPEAELLSRDEFVKIPELLNGKTQEDAKKCYAEQRKRLAAELAQIPARMDELERTFQPVDEAEAEQARKSIAELDKQIAAIENELADTQGAVNRMNDLLRQKSEASKRIADLEAAAQRAHNQKVDELSQAYARLRAEQMRVDEDIKLDTARMDIAKREMDRLTQIRQDLLTRYHQLEAQTAPVFEVSNTCETCGQHLPDDRIAQTLARLKEQWQNNHAAQMKDVLEQGKAIKQQIEALQADADAKTTRLQELNAHKNTLDEQVEQANKAASIEAANVVDVQSMTGYAEAKTALDEISAKIEDFGTDNRRQTLLESKAAITAQYDAPRAVLARLQQGEAIHKRMDELTAEKKRIGAQMVDVDGKLELLSEYARAYCSAMEFGINSRFKLIRWRLFDIAKNGNVQDCCTATVGGVAYGEGLNNGASINAGIEIIRVLSQAYAVSAPCFVDNAEAVNTLARTDGQMIELRVSNDEALTLTLIPSDEEMQNAC